MVIGCPGMYGTCLWKAMFLFQIWPVLYLKMFSCVILELMA